MNEPNPAVIREKLLAEHRTIRESLADSVEKLAQHYESLADSSEDSAPALIGCLWHSPLSSRSPRCPAYYDSSELVHYGYAGEVRPDPGGVVLWVLCVTGEMRP